MLVLLPFILLAIIYILSRSYVSSWRDAILSSALIFGVFIAISTEFLSALNAITQPAIALAHLLFLSATIYYLSKRRGFTFKTSTRLSSPQDTPGTQGTAFFAGIILILITVALTALLVPPNIWDAMAYHMPRVVYWIQHRNVAFYPTVELHQLFMPPWAEYAILHLHILSGTDYFDSFIQVLAFAGTIVATSLIAAALGATRRGQLLTAVFCATIPQAILSASGTKNDHVLSFWLATMVYYTLKLKHSATWPTVLALSAALGLACFTKGTAYVLAPPFIMVGLILSRRHGSRTLVFGLLTLLFVPFVINSGQYIRNVRLFHSPLGPGSPYPGTCEFANATYGISTLAANTVRNAALHLATPSSAVNLRIESRVRALLASFHIDADDPDTTFCGTRFALSDDGRIEDTKSNGIHFYLVLFLVATLIVKRWWKVDAIVCLYVLAIIAGFAGFCLAFRWQPWHTRLHLPLFVLWAPAFGVLVGDALSPRFGSALGVVLLMCAGPVLFGNELRPLLIRGRLFPDLVWNVDRSELYFAGRTGLRKAYMDVASRIRQSGCDTVGLDDSDNQIYPMLKLLGADSRKRTVFNIGVSNISTRTQNLPGGHKRPCAAVCMDCSNPSRWSLFTDTVYSVARFQNMAVFFPSTAVGHTGTEDRRLQSTVSIIDGSMHVGLTGPTAPSTNVAVLLNTTLVGSGACWIQCDPADRIVRLVKDSGDGAVGSLPFGGSGVLENGKCRLFAKGSSVDVGTDYLKITLRVEATSEQWSDNLIFLYTDAARAPNLQNVWELHGSVRQPR